MARKPKSNNFDALGSIYDFIFAEAKKAPDKRKPIKPTGVAGDSAITDAVFSALERPGAFLSNTVINEFNNALDIEIGRVTYGEFGNVKFSTTSLIDTLKDPEGAFNKAIAKNRAIRNTQKAVFIGGAFDSFIHSAWAKKFADLEVQKALYGNAVIKDAEREAEKFKIREALGQYTATHSGATKSKLQETFVPGKFSPSDRNFIAGRSFDLLSNKIFEPQVWRNLSDTEKAEFASMLSGGKKISEIRDYVVQRHSARGIRVMTEIGNRFDRVLAPTNKKSSDTLDILSPDIYKALEEQNIQDRIRKSKNPGERAMYEKTLYLLKRDRRGLIDSINNIQSALKTATTSADKKRLKGELRDAKSALHIVDGDNFIGRVGQFEGYLNSFQNVYGGVLGSNVVASILNGRLYDKNQNSLFNPVVEKNVRGVEGILVARTYDPAKKDVSHKILGKYNQVLTDLNYLTPRSFARTLFYNGEGFAYQLYKTGDKIAGIDGFDLLNVSKDDLLKGLTGNDVSTYLDNLVTTSQNILSPKSLEQLKKYAGRSKRLSNATYSFSGLYRFQQRMNKAFGKIFEKRRAQFASWILKSPKIQAAFAKVGADAVLKFWVVKGGLNNLMKGLVTGLASAAGITLGPVGSFVAGIVTAVVSEWAMKLAGVGINLLKWALLGFVGLFVIIFAIGTDNLSKYNKQTLSYRSEIPGDIIMCSAYEEIELEEGEEPWGDTIVPPPSGESCVLGAGSFGCSQGFVDVEGWSHQRVGHLMPVDLTGISYIYAPQFCSTGDCSITRIAKINCADGSNAGGVVEMTASTGSTTYLFKLLHVKPLAGLGEKLSGGQPVAVVQSSPEVERGWCWTGKHLHLETKQNGAVVDPLELLQSFSCGVPDESSCANP